MINRKILVVVGHVFVLWLVVALTASATEKFNCVADFLNGAEMQLETREQRLELQKALQEMLTVKPELLLKKRYKDYTMQPNRWNALNVLERYFVPNKRNHLEPNCFLSSISSASAHKAIERQLAHLDKVNAP